MTEHKHKIDEYGECIIEDQTGCNCPNCTEKNNDNEIVIEPETKIVEETTKTVKKNHTKTIVIGAGAALLLWYLLKH